MKTQSRLKWDHIWLYKILYSLLHDQICQYMNKNMFVYVLIYNSSCSNPKLSIYDHIQTLYKNINGLIWLYIRTYMTIFSIKRSYTNTYIIIYVNIRYQNILTLAYMIIYGLIYPLQGSIYDHKRCQIWPYIFRSKICHHIYFRICTYMYIYNNICQSSSW